MKTESTTAHPVGRMLNRLALSHRQLLGAWTLLLAALFFYKGLYVGLKGPAGDFANYYTASKLALAHQFSDPHLYEFYEFNQVLAPLFPGTLGGFIPHPSPAVLPMMPLTLLAPPAARSVFLLFNVVLLVPIIAGLSRITRLDWLPVTCLTLMGGISLWANFWQGQLYLLLLASLVGGTWLYLQGKSFWAGVLFGLFIPIKYFPVVYVLYFLVRRDWRLVLGATLSAAAIALLGLFFTGLEFNAFFLTHILPPHLAGRIVDPFTVHFQSYASLLNRLLVYEPSLNAAPVLNSPFARDFLKTFLGLAFLTFTLAGIRCSGAQSERQRALNAIALLTLGGLVSSPATATYYLVVLTLPVVLLAGSHVERTGKWPVALVILYVLVNLFPFYRFKYLDNHGWLTLLAYGRLYALTALFFLSLPRPALRARACCWGLVASLAISISLAFLRPAPDPDGAVWAGYEGLIMRKLSQQDGTLYYARDTEAGFARFANGEPTQTLPPLPRALSRDGTYWVFSASVGASFAASQQIFVSNTVSRAVAQLTKDGGKNIEPIWSDDDRQIFFLSDRGRGIDCTTIYRLAFDPSRFNWQDHLWSMAFDGGH